MSGIVSLVFFHDLTRLSFLPSEAQRVYQGVTQTLDPEGVLALHTILQKNTNASESWSVPYKSCKHSTAVVSYHQLLPENWSLFLPLCLARDITKGNE